MTGKTIMYEKLGAVCIITINRPEEDNAINTQVADELTEICNAISLDGEIKVAIFTGAGKKAFSIGADTNELRPAVNKQEPKLLSVAVPVANLKCPTIAAINGDAFGQGLELALACDLRIAADTARFAASHIGTGFIPWDGATQRLPRLIGMSKAMELVLAGETIDAKEARQIGLVNSLVSREELIPTITTMGQTMASKSPLALSFAKEAINKGMDMTIEQGLRLEADLYFLLHTTEDRTEGIRAFLEKRPPQFKGK